VNWIERRIDGLPGQVSVRLRLLKARLRRDRMLDLMRQHVRQGQHVVDVGANRGVYTLFLASLVGSRGRVDAIDPFPANVRRIIQALGRRGNVQVHCVAVSDRHGTASLYVPLHHGLQIDALATLGAEPSVDHDTLEVPIVPLDDLLADCRTPVDFMKIDVEGHEPAVLAGATATLAGRPTLLMEVEQRHHPDLDIKDVFKTMRELGYEAFAVFEDGPAPLDRFSVERDQLAYVTGDFEAYAMPSGYVSDFLFLPRQ
jgi:FkbM family methyltransferase